MRQFIQAAGAWAHSQEDEAAIGRYLAPQAVELFRSMPRYDRQHALNVFRTLQGQGRTEPDLLAAALLHDVGKSLPRSGGVRLWHRVTAVLMRALWPGLLERLGREDLEGWRRPYYIQQHHAAIGAELAQQAGCPPGIVALIQHHEDPPGPAVDPLLAALLAADSSN